MLAVHVISVHVIYIALVIERVQIYARVRVDDGFVVNENDTWFRMLN